MSTRKSQNGPKKPCSKSQSCRKNCKGATLMPHMQLLRTTLFPKKHAYNAPFHPHIGELILISKYQSLVCNCSLQKYNENMKLFVKKGFFTQTMFGKLSFMKALTKHLANLWVITSLILFTFDLSEKLRGRKRRWSL